MTTPWLAFLGNLGGFEWLVILIVAVLLFGRRLPEIARSLGKSLSEFKRGVKEVEEDLHPTTKEDTQLDDTEPPKP